MRLCPKCKQELAFYTIRYKGDMRLVVWYCKKCKEEIELIG